MAKLKDPEQRHKTKYYEGQIEKRQKDIEELKRKQAKFKDKKERCKKYEEKIICAMQRQGYYYLKTKDPIAICEDYEISPTVNKYMVEFHLKHLFPHGNPYVSIMLMDGTANRRMMDINTARKKMPHLLSFDMNTYISPATYAHQRKTTDSDGDVQIIRGAYKSLIIDTSAIIIDLDYRNTYYSGMLSEDFYQQMKEELAFSIIPEPSYCVVSSEGRGMQMIYLLSEPYKTHFKQFEIERYEDTVRRMIEHFKPFGSDPACCDISHLFRCPSSYNTKSFSYAFILDWEQLRDDEYEPARYSFEELEKCSLEALGAPTAQPEPERVPVPPPKKKAPVKPSKSPKHTNASEDLKSSYKNTIKTLAFNRCRDLKLLAGLRKANDIGFRNNLIHIYGSQYIWLCNDNEELLEELYAVNNLLSSPLDDREIEDIAKSLSKKRYKYSDDTIRNLLHITPFEIECMQAIGHNMSVEEARIQKNFRRRKKRLENGCITAEVRAARNKEIIELKKQGWTNRQLMDKYKLSKVTIIKICHAIPKEG